MSEQPPSGNQQVPPPEPSQGQHQQHEQGPSGAPPAEGASGGAPTIKPATIGLGVATVALGAGVVVASVTGRGGGSDSAGGALVVGPDATGPNTSPPASASSESTSSDVTPTPEDSPDSTSAEAPLTTSDQGQPSASGQPSAQGQPSAPVEPVDDPDSLTGDWAGTAVAGEESIGVKLALSRDSAASLTGHLHFADPVTGDWALAGAITGSSEGGEVTLVTTGDTRFQLVRSGEALSGDGWLTDSTEPFRIQVSLTRQ